jgi:hypothetical protein
MKMGLMIGMVAAGLLSAGGGSGCTSLQARMSGTRYKEVAHEGRVYVMGKAETIKKLGDKPEFPYATTKIGAGVGGATVVIEADPKDDMFAKKLWQLYTRRHNLRR